MGREAERSTISSAIQEGWKPEFGVIAWPNQPFVAPPGQRWAQVTILTYSTDRISLGKEHFLKRTIGSVQIDIFCPQDQGAAGNKKISDYLEDFYEDRIFVISTEEKIEFGTPESRETTGVQERQEGTNDNWFRTVVDIPFQRYVHIIKSHP